MDIAMLALLLFLGILLVSAPRMAAAATRTFTGRWLQAAKAPELFKVDSKRLAPGDYVAGQAVGQVSTLTAANDVQTVTITGTPTSGSFRLQDPTSGKVTVAIAYNAVAADVQAALVTIFGTGNVTVTGGPGPGTAWVITFSGQAASLPQQLMTIYTSTFGGGTTPAIAIVHTTTGRMVGGAWATYATGNTDGTGTCKGFVQYDTTVNSNGRVFTGFSDIGAGGYSAPVVIGGYVRTVDLTGLDTDAIADLGRLSDGDAGNLTNPGTILKIN